MSEIVISLLDDSGIKTLEKALKQKPFLYSLDKLEEDLRWALPIVEKFNRRYDGAWTTFDATYDYLFDDSDKEKLESESTYSVRINPDIGIVELEVKPTELVIENHYDRAKLEHLKDRLIEVRKAHISFDSTLREFARANGYTYESPFGYKLPTPKEQNHFLDNL